MVIQTHHAVISAVEGLEIESKEVKYGVVMLRYEYGLPTTMECRQNAVAGRNWDLGFGILAGGWLKGPSA